MRGARPGPEATAFPDGTNAGGLYAPVVRAAVAPLWAAWEKSPYLRHLARFKRTQHRPLSEVRADQFARLKILLDHAYSHTRFYRERMDAAGLRPGDVRGWEDLLRLPVLTKDDIRAHKDGMVADDIPKDQLRAKKTSGSTGVSLSFYVDEDSMQWKRGCAMRHDEWTGWRLGERVGAVWGNPEYKKSWRGYLRNFLLERFTYLDTLRMDDAAMLDFYRAVLRDRPTLLFGHAHSLYLFARFLHERGLSGVRPKGIISTAMVLHDFERALVEEVFGCPVTNRYGCEEVSLIACECREHNGLHVNMDTLVVECLCDGRPAAPGETGALVLTDLTNYGMPFIRYLVGDTARMSERACPCGCTYPLIESLEGRIADYVRTPEGEFVSGISLTENFAMVLDGVKQLQIVQDAVDHLLFRVVRGEGEYAGLAQDIARLVRERFGEGMRHDIEYVPSIQSESSGKYRFCVSKLPPDQLWGAGGRAHAGEVRA
ncbi:CapK related-protein [Desulfovibrio sp. X2]|uniref:phenylacetate--CoA ligase family protein n=1 Tax=Desulfovibrio sp. X2 TaxID=941449 RepID=UPI000358E8CA|nr:phenylacetate--CoA ligase family protein [Desulfovibrio sp. X2]EPR37242.1 CapK related-protein [Desulfovibrio sp. X2]